MFQKLRTFWNNFWFAIKTAYNKAFKEIPKERTQNFRDTKRINFLAIFVSKLNNLSNIESTYGVESDSVQAERLKELVKDIEKNRFEITESMLGDGDLWVFPSHDSSGNLFHRYVNQDYVRILNTEGDRVTDLIGVIDEYATPDGNTFFLNRRHTLEGDRLTVETYTTNERNERVLFPDWEELESLVVLQGVDSIGVGRFKSPTSSRGLSPVYGVPLNFGCEEIENKIFHDLELIEREFETTQSKVFADPRILRKRSREDGETYSIPEWVFPTESRAGQSGSSIDIFSPAIRYSEYQSKLVDDMKQYEQQVGTDRGFLTPFESGNSATATEIRRANASTIALIDKIHAAIQQGVTETIKADAMFLNVAADLYTVVFDFFDAFEDTDKQYERLSNAVDRGVAEKDDELQWLFPSMTEEERAEKLARISANTAANTDSAIERILNGGV